MEMHDRRLSAARAGIWRLRDHEQAKQEAKES